MLAVLVTQAALVRPAEVSLNSPVTQVPPPQPVVPKAAL